MMLEDFVKDKKMQFKMEGIDTFDYIKIKNIGSSKYKSKNPSHKYTHTL